MTEQTEKQKNKSIFAAGNRTKLISAVVAFLIAGYAAAGFFAVPYFAGSRLVSQLESVTGRKVMIEKVRFNPFTFSASVHNIEITGKEKQIFFCAERLYGNVSASSIFSFALVISRVELDAPCIHLVRFADGKLNISDLIPPPEKEKENEAGTDPEIPREIFPVIVKAVRITDGKLDFSDQKTAVNHQIRNFSLDLTGLSTRMKDVDIPAVLQARFALNGADVTVQSEALLFGAFPQVSTALDLQSLDLCHYLPYVQIPEALRVQGADMALSLQTRFKGEKAHPGLNASGTIRFSGIQIQDSEGKDLLLLPEAQIQMDPSELLASEINIAQVLVSDLKTTIELDQQGKIKPQLLPAQKPVPEPAKAVDQTADSPQVAFKPQVHLKKAEIRNAEVSFTDHRTDTPFQTRISPLDIEMSDLEIREQVSGKLLVKLMTDLKESVSLSGGFNLFPFSATGHFAASQIRGERYRSYVKQYSGFDVQKGQIDFACDFDLKDGSEPPEKGFVPAGAVTAVNLGIKDFSLVEKAGSKPVLAINRFGIANTALDLAKKEINTEKVTADGLEGHVERLKDGRINVVYLAPKSNAPKTHQAPSPGENSPWLVSVQALDIKNTKMNFKDLVPTDPVDLTVSDITVNAASVSTKPGVQGKVTADMKWEQEGRIHMSGSVAPGDLAADLDLNLEKIGIQAVQPYFTEFVKITVTQGDFQSKGKVKVRGKQEKDRILFNGDLALSRFVSLDKKNAQDFFKCNSFYLSEVDLNAFPVAVEIGKISLTDFFSRVIVHETGQVNLNNIFKSQTPPASETQASEQNLRTAEKEPVKVEKQGPSPEIIIDNITVQNGNINFTDSFTKPNFTADMKEISGAVTGLSTDPDTRADLTLQGVHGISSRLDITGKINPLARKKFADISISYKDIELTHFTPYAAKFLGYKIEKGKLILDLHYLINGNELESENKARFDRLTLGESVESEHATSLPVSLAISLLKDRDGQINLDLPVTGHLDDPEFRIGSIIWKMIGNLILKAATSPFSLIGSLFGGGEDLGYVAFAPGAETLSEKAAAKLETLAEVLEKKPDISLEIQGRYHVETDTAALRAKGFTDLLKAEKLQEMIKAGNPVTELSEVRILDSEKERLIPLAFQKADFPKPRDAEGNLKKLSVKEKSVLLETSVPVSESDLRLLAMNRATRIQSDLVSNLNVPKERVFLLEPVPETAERPENIKAVFSLK